MNLYNKDGWIDIPAIRRATPQAFLYVLIGARQIGKTYGIIDYFHACNEPYIYMRGTAEELRYSLSTRANLYAEKSFPWADDMKIEKGQPTTVYDAGYMDGTKPAALALALSDVAKIRGFGGKNYKRIFYDEFIPEETAYFRKGMGMALQNAYVTINSNRETLGEPPAELWLAANSNNLDNDILAAFNLTGKLLSMQKKNQTFSYLPERRLCMMLFNNSPVSERMRKTALFQCIGTDDKFSKMALENVFINDDDTGVASRPIIEYVPLCQVDELTVFRHKTNREWYIVPVTGQSELVFDSNNPTSYKSFLEYWKHMGTVIPVDGQNIFYAAYTAKLDFYRLLKL